MKTALLVALLIGLAAAAAVMLKTKGKSQERKGKVVKKRLITAHENVMFWRLCEAFPKPEYVVLAQVSFGALLDAKDGAARGAFSQKIADFVLTDKLLNAVAIIELDDSSHRGKETKDSERDAMLTNAGYKVLRYKQIPTIEKLKEDMTTPNDSLRGS